MDENNKNKRSEWLFKGIGMVIGALSFVVAIMGLSTYLNDRIESIVFSDIFMQKVSQELRPFVIFDQTEKIIFDHGAMRYLDSIVVIDTAVDLSHFRVVQRIIVYAKQLLPISPRLESQLTVTANRRIHYSIGTRKEV